MENETLKHLLQDGIISSLDVHFAQFMERLDGGRRPELSLAAAMVSSCTRQGHICLDLRRPGRSLPVLTDPQFPDYSAWVDELSKTAVVGRPGEFRPLVLDATGRLYLYRYWEYQEKLAQALKARIAGYPLPPAQRDLQESLDRLFPRQQDGVDWQKMAAFVGACKPFCVVSGGPGTGKTTTVAKMLALFIEQQPASRLRIALAAPTGKAAARLQETLKAAKARLACSDAVREAIPEEASTIHRLLGSKQGSPYFRHNEENLLPLDILVVDEASMVDLPLMSKLVQALPLRTRLILLGDRDQLSSVEAGAVLGDICETGGQLLFSTDFARACEELCGSRLDNSLIDNAAGAGTKPRDCIVQLQRSYRFSGDSGIANLSQAVRNYDAEGAVSVLRSGSASDLAYHELPSAKMLGKLIKDEVIAGYSAYLKESYALEKGSGQDPFARLARVFDLFEGFRILCAVRGGPCGVGAVNILVENMLEDAGLLTRGKTWYVGRPVLIRRNDYNLRLFNGDIGIFLPDVVSGSDFRVFFPGSEGRFRVFHPLRLPEHETVYAMTIHKSQGSEFDNVLLVLPDRDSPVLTRELIYTGITRAKQKVSLWGSEAILRTAIARATERLSGLSEALWGRSR